jgi:DNA-binding CsgD family transcriptional regulator
LALGGRVDEALTVGERAAGRGSRAVVVQLARACVIAERWGPARGWLDSAGLPSSDGEGQPEPAVLALAAHVALAEGDRDQAVRLASAAVAEGTRAHHVETVCEALEITGRAQRRADPPASRAAFARGERLAAAHGLVPWRLRALAELGGLDLLEGGDTGRLVAARRLAEECGMLGLAVGLDLQIAVDTFGGDGPVSALGPARRCAERSTRLRLSGPATHAGIFVARGLFWAGEVQASYALFDELARMAPHPTYVGSSRAAIGGFAAWLAHDPRGAVDGLGACVAELRESAVTNPAPVWGEWALLATVVDPEDPRPLAELRNADVLVQASNRAAVHYAEAVLARRDGRTDVAADLIARGDAALGRRVHSRLLLRCLMLGPDDAPEPLLREVIAHAEPRGEVQLTRWCRDRLRRAGRPVPRPNRDAVAVPERLRAHGVTGRELEVLRLVARGWSNADVAAHLHLSVRTVETHVSNLLAKTSATDRSGLSAHLDP